MPGFLVIGGTGFVGYHATLELARRGHRTTVLALELPEPDLFPPEVAVVLADYNTLDDDRLSDILAGHDGIVFAAGADDRVMPKAPAYEFFHKHNVAAVERIFALARQAGVTRGVVCGSYFSYFDRIHPEWRLAARHPYVRSRKEQARAAIAAGGDEMAVCILELPYIFGSMPGRVPLWNPLVAYLRSRWPLFYTRGGTNMIAVEHVAEAVAGALERGEAGASYPIGDENRTWPEFLEPMSSMAGRPKRVRTLPTFLVYMVMLVVQLVHRCRGLESGLNPTGFIQLQTRNTFFDPTPSRTALGYGYGGLEQALQETVDACPRQFG